MLNTMMAGQQKIVYSAGTKGGVLCPAGTVGRG